VLLASLGKLVAPRRSNLYLFSKALHDYIERLAASMALGELSQLIEGLNSYLERQPLLHLIR